MSEPRHGDEVPIFVDIRRNVDGAVRTVSTEAYWNDGRNDPTPGPELFIWQEGNQSCDCNRADEFARAGGEADPDVECGSEAFSIQVRDGSGRVIYSEWDGGQA